MSESATVHLVNDETLVAQIIPELRIPNRYSSHIVVPILTGGDEQGTAPSRVEYVRFLLYLLATSLTTFIRRREAGLAIRAASV